METEPSPIIQKGIDKVVKSYTGEGTLINGGGKAASATVGAIAKVKAVPKTATIVGKGLSAKIVSKASTKVVTKAALKGACKGLGVVGFIPDAITFGIGVKEGIDEAIENKNSSSNKKSSSNKNPLSWLTVL